MTETSDSGRTLLTDYVVTAGPLSGFEFLYDPRLDRIKDLRDFHTMELTPKTIPDRKFSDYRRVPKRELAFVTAFMRAVAQDHRLMCGFRDVNAQRASELGLALKKQSAMRWIAMKYGVADDDLVLFEMKDLKADFAPLARTYPPADGEVFFYLTNQNFDIFEVYWRRKSEGSLRAKEEHFRRDVVAFGHKSSLTFFVDADGSFTVLSHPKFLDNATVQRLVTEAGRRSQMTLTMAPGLFG